LKTEYTLTKTTKHQAVITAALLGILLTALCIHAQTSTPNYVVVDLGTLGGTYSYAQGINASGQVVGYADVASSGWFHAFLYSNGTMRDLGTLNGIASYAHGINDGGQVIGYYQMSGDSSPHAFLYSNGSMQDLNTLGGVFGYSDAAAINNKGQVVGRFETPTGSHAYLYSGGSMRDIHTLGNQSVAVGINDGGQITGTFFVSTSSNTIGRPFFYSDGTMQDLNTLGGTTGQSYGINDKGHVVGEAYTSGNAAYHVFLYSPGGGMRDLNVLRRFEPPTVFGMGINSIGQVVISRSTNYYSYLYSNGVAYNLGDITYPSGWTIVGVNGINDSGQIAATGYYQSPSSYHALRLDPLPPGWKEVIQTSQPQPTYGACPDRLPGKDSLIVVTHGWDPDPNWVIEMTNSITRYLTDNGLSNWQVHAHMWVEKAQLPFELGLGPERTLRIAAAEGGGLGTCLAKSTWSHIHFIAHSAGAPLIQTASEVIKAQPLNQTDVHTTFLDAFVGATYGGKHKYGMGANWSDSYFTRDPDTILTDKLLDNAYNVDVTFLDLIHRQQIKVTSSTPTGEISKTCFQTVSSHEWPHQFYIQTIPPRSLFGSEGFGFPLSKEAGHWTSLPTLYPVGATHSPLGSGELSCIPDTKLTVSATPKKVEFTNADIIRSTTGSVIIHGIDFFSLHTGSPVWMAIVVPTTNTFNLLSFESQFTSTNNAEGLLSVFWNTNLLGLLDERAVLPGIRQYSLSVPGKVTGTHLLGFRLDSFSPVTSSVLVTNVSLRFVGVPSPFSLTFTGSYTNALPIFQLNGPQGYNYSVETSTNLIDWSTSIILVNTNGIVRFTDTTAANANSRFYRGVVP
jgi:probable HAF family extracellular repeat protein